MSGTVNQNRLMSRMKVVVLRCSGHSAIACASMVAKKAAASTWVTSSR
jgi:hypothetical protein